MIDATDGPASSSTASTARSVEALRSAHEGVSDPQTIDALIRLGGGYRMGPFELQDLVGIETGFVISKSFFRAASASRAGAVAAQRADGGQRRYGRKTKHGWYDYDGDGPYRPADPEAPPVGGGDSNGVSILGGWPVAAAVRERAEQAGWASHGYSGMPLIVDCSGDPESQASGPRAVLHVNDELPAGTVGFHTLPTLGLVELTRDETTPDELAGQVERFFTTLGAHTRWIGDSPGGVLGHARLPDDQRGELRARRGRRRGGRHRRGHGAGMTTRAVLAWLEMVGPTIVTVLDALRERHGDRTGRRVAAAGLARLGLNSPKRFKRGALNREGRRQGARRVVGSNPAHDTRG